MSLLYFRRRSASYHLNPTAAKFVTVGFSLALIPSPTTPPRSIANPRNGLRLARVLSTSGRDKARRDTPFRLCDVRPEVPGLRRDFFGRVMAREQNGCRVMSPRVITRESFETGDCGVMVRVSDLTDQNHDASQLLSL